MNEIIFEIEEDIENNSERYKSVLSIPRLTGNGLEADIREVLNIIYNNPKIDNNYLIQVFMEKYNLANNTAKNIRPTLERANILLKSKNGLILTRVGSEYLVTREVSYLGKGFLENYFGFLEILLLVVKNQPQKILDIFPEWEDFYRREYGERKKETSLNQFYKIFAYLSELHYVQKGDQSYIINKDLYDKSKKIPIF